MQTVENHVWFQAQIKHHSTPLHSSLYLSWFCQCYGNWLYNNLHTNKILLSLANCNSFWFYPWSAKNWRMDKHRYHQWRARAREIYPHCHLWKETGFQRRKGCNMGSKYFPSFVWRPFKCFSARIYQKTKHNDKVGWKWSHNSGHNILNSYKCQIIWLLQ